MNPRYLVGLDLGQANDFSAWAVALQHDHGTEPASYDVPHLDRIRGARYPAVVEHTRALIEALLAQDPRPDVDLVVDFTGVGRAVADMVIEAELGARVTLVTITGGDAVTRGERGEWRAPKRDLASVVQVALQSSRLRIGAELTLAETLTQELTNFKVKIALNGHDSYAAGADWRDGNHDDLVLALALAIWQGERTPRPVVVAPGGVTGGTLFSRDDDYGGFGFGSDPWA